MTEKLFLYTDSSWDFGKDNIFLSRIYDNQKSFNKENKFDNYEIISEYNFSDIFNTSKIKKSLEEKEDYLQRAKVLVKRLLDDQHGFDEEVGDLAYRWLEEVSDE